jgi:hypothetical protein
MSEAAWDIYQAGSSDRCLTDKPIKEDADGASVGAVYKVCPAGNA